MPADISLAALIFRRSADEAKQGTHNKQTRNIGDTLKQSQSLFSHLKLEAVSILATLTLAACGGGSSGGTEGQSNNSTQSSAPSAAATLITPAASQLALPTASGDATADSVAYVNTIRQNAGLTPMSVDAGLATAALDHATYLVDNEAAGHYETTGLPGFTGADPMTRVLAEGSYSAVGETVVAGNPAAFADSLSGVQDLFDAPFHRLIMLGDFKSFGVGSMTNASWEAINLDYGNTANKIPGSGIVVYPYPGETGVPAKWFANESPNPFAGSPSYELTYVGYPVTANTNLNGKLSSVAFTLTDASGNNVACLLQSPDNNSTELSNAAMCIPYAPLAGNTAYTAHLTGVLTSSGQTYPINVTWSFTTGVSAVQNTQVIGQPTTRPLPKF